VNAEWQRDKERKRLERDMRRFERSMATPILRGEALSLGEMQLEHIASLALALETLETLLVERGTLKDGELMERMKVLAAAKREQAEAQVSAAEAQPDSNLIIKEN
jgi:hypothetical protein